MHNDLVTSFVSRPWLAIGHALVVPNRHVIRPDNLNDQEVLAIHREADRLADKLARIAIGIDRFQKTRTHVPEGAIKRDHLHLHLLPSKPGDWLYDHGVNWGDEHGWAQPTEAELQEMLDLLRA